MVFSKKTAGVDGDYGSGRDDAMFKLEQLAYINEIEEKEDALYCIAHYQDMMLRSETVYHHPLRTFFASLRSIYVRIREYRQSSILYQEALQRYCRILGLSNIDEASLRAELASIHMSDFSGGNSNTVEPEEVIISDH